MGKEGFPRAGPVLLAVQPVIAIGCNWTLICVSVFEFFPAPSLKADIILARSSQNYPKVAPTSQGGFGVMELRLSASIP
jgi:hypothetical protein